MRYHSFRIEAESTQVVGRTHRTIVLLLVALGVLLRMRQFVADRSFYSDEAFAAINIASRSFGELLRPLDWDQNGPPLFLWIERLLVMLGGAGEQTMRLYPLICGVVLLPVSWMLSRRLLPVAAACLVLAAVAMSPLLIYYSNELKPYESDALASAVLMLIALRLINDPASQRRWAFVAVTGVVAILISSPAVFVLGGIGLALLLSKEVRSTRAGMLRIVGVGVLWGGVFLAIYIAVLKPAADNPFLRRFFADRFVRLDIGNTKQRFATVIYEALVPIWSDHPSFLPPNFLTFLVLLGAIGVYAFWRSTNRAALTLLIAPIALAGAASVLGKYPLLTRTLLFAMPGIIVLTVGGLDALARALISVTKQVAARQVQASGYAIVTTLGCAILLAPALISDVLDASTPPVIQNARPLIAEFMAQSTPTEPVYVTHWGRAAWAYYTTDWRTADTARLHRLYRAMRSRLPGDTQVHSAESETASFSFAWGRRTELIQQLPPNVMMTADIAPVEIRPPAHWSVDEAARICIAANPDIWLFLIHGPVRYRSDLLRAIQDKGGRVVYARVEGEDAQLYHVRFPIESKDCCAPLNDRPYAHAHAHAHAHAGQLGAGPG